MEDMFIFASARNIDTSQWDLSEVQSMQGAFNQTGLSTENYLLSLVGWVKQATLQTNVNLGASNTSYNSSAVDKN